VNQLIRPDFEPHAGQPVYKGCAGKMCRLNLNCSDGRLKNSCIPPFRIWQKSAES